MTPAELVDRILNMRGYADAEARQKFLHPKYEDMHDPFLMHDMEKAIARIFLAMQRNEKICIYSDYDADGIPGAVILHDFFKKVGYENFCNYIPHRHEEGYGVHKDALQSLQNEGVSLVITVDVGITAVDEIIFGNSLGLEIIVTDHHEPLDVLPPAYALVNPKLGSYPDRMLCGAGVAFKLVQALLNHPSPLRGAPLIKGGHASELSANSGPSSPSSDEEGAGGGGSRWNIPPGWEKWLLDMAGLATLSDMVPLVNENRIIAYYGMKVLPQTKRPGLRALFQKSGLSMNHLTETDIVFSITPKLNAAGRMAHPVDAFNALATTDARKGMIAAEHLAGLNDERKKIVARIMKDVHKKVSARKSDGEIGKILVIGDPSWPAGILGLVASKIVEEYSVTTFVWGAEGESIKGSSRGIGDVSVVTLMQSVSHLLVQFGGHEDAGGFTATRETIHFLEEEFCKQYETHKHAVSRQAEASSYDMELDLADVTMKHYTAMRALAPFGMANEKPVFAFKDVKIESVKQFGKTTEHLEIMVSRGGVSRRAISWYANPESFTEKVEEGSTMTLLAEFDHSVFRGKEELRLMIKDVIR